jgi:hypothetical protein
MSDLTKQAEPVVQRLLKADDRQLYEQLGIRELAIEKDPTKADFFDPQVTYDQAQMGAKEDVEELGKRIFDRWNIEAYKLVCGSDVEDIQDRQELLNAFGISDVAVAATLSALLVTNLGISAAIAAVVATLIIKRFFRPAQEEFCLVWKKKLPEAVE